MLTGSVLCPGIRASSTGLHASSHGIVANDFYSPTLQKRFLYTDPAQSWDAAWWLGEPIWASAEAAGVPTAVVMWPGPPRTARGDRPAAFTPYEDGWPLTRKASKVLELLDREDKERPQLILGESWMQSVRVGGWVPFRIQELIRRIDRSHSLRSGRRQSRARQRARQWRSALHARRCRRARDLPLLRNPLTQLDQYRRPRFRL